MACNSLSNINLLVDWGRLVDRRVPLRHTRLRFCRLAACGAGLSAAIGATRAHPEVPVLAAVGDGGFSMNAQELETAERVSAPFITASWPACR